jgi:hypothetical protein
VTQTQVFKNAAVEVVQSHIERLRTSLSFADALALPEASAQDIVVAGKEVQLAIHRYASLPFLSGKVLVVVLIARHVLGGMASFHTERGLVFSPGGAPRDATDQELQNSGG